MRKYVAQKMNRFAVLILVGLVLSACDESRTDVENVAGAPEVEATTSKRGDEPLARYDEGELSLLVSTGEARERIMTTTRALIPSVEEVDFGTPELRLIEGRPYLTMKGQRPDGNCALAYVRLVSETALDANERHAVSERLAGGAQDVVLFGPPSGGSCIGGPCNGCDLVVTSDGERCYCRGIGKDGKEGWCNHSTNG